MEYAGSAGGGASSIPAAADVASGGTSAGKGEAGVVSGMDGAAGTSGGAAGGAACEAVETDCAADYPAGIDGDFRTE